MPIRRLNDAPTETNPSTGTVRRKRGATPEVQVTSEVVGKPIESTPFDDLDGHDKAKFANSASSPGRVDRPVEDDDLGHDVESLEMDNGFAEVVKNFFGIASPSQEADELRRFLSGKQKPSRMSYGEVADELGESQENAMRGAELLGQAKVTHERFEFDASLIEATMREAAQKEIEGERTTKPTIADIEARMRKMYPDQMRDLLVKRRENKEALALFEALAFRLSERARDLRQILARVQRPGEL